MYLHDVSDEVLQKMLIQYERKVERIDNDLPTQLDKPQMCQDIRDALTEIYKEVNRRVI